MPRYRPTLFNIFVIPFCPCFAEASAYTAVETFTTLGIGALNAATTVGTQQNLEEATRLHFYPNPVSSNLRLEYSLGQTEGFLSIYHVSGQKVLDRFLSNEDASIDLDLGHLEQGYYLIQLTDGENVITKRLAKVAR